MTPPIQHIDPDAVPATALELAARGWPVFPCVPGQKRPLTRHGLHDATTDPDRIRGWWRRCPTANLAVPTGPRTVDVLDVDVHPGGNGYPAFNQLKQAGLLVGYTTVVATPSGGLHLYFPGTDQPSSRLPAQHLDLKAAGGYVLVPPSVVGGAGYDVVRQIADPATARPLAWTTVRCLLEPPPPAPAKPASRPRRQSDRGDIAALARWVEYLPEGRRNAGTYWAACRAVEQGATDLTPLVDAAVRSGLTEREATRTIASATQRLNPTPAGATRVPTVRGRQRPRGRS